MSALKQEPLTPRTAVLGPVNREIHDWLRENGPVKLLAVQVRFRNLALSQGKGGSQFILDRLCQMRERGQVRRIVGEHGNTWDIVREGDVVAEPAPILDNVAQPRRMNIFGPVYVPPKDPVRAGAMDYAAAPSLHMGQRVAFRGGR